MKSYTDIEQSKKLAEMLSGESVDDHLDEAAEDNLGLYESEWLLDGKTEMYYGSAVIDAFKTGSSWMKEQMLKDAIDATVYKGFNKFKQGDNVKMILIKKE